MQRFSKSLMIGALTSVTAGVLAAITIVPASAQVLVGIDNYGGNLPGNTSYNAATGFSIGTPPTGHLSGLGFPGQPPLDANATIVFGPLTNNGTLGVTAGAFDQALNGGSFKITDGATVLLQGTFGPSNLTGNIGGTSGTLNLATSSLTYGGTGGPGTFFPAGFLTTNGSLAVGFTSTTLFTGTNGGTLGTFTGTDVISFAARQVAVPEPGSVALLSSLAVCGSAFGLRRLRRNK